MSIYFLREAKKNNDATFHIGWKDEHLFFKRSEEK